jgi:hypothetical protein
MNCSTAVQRYVDDRAPVIAGMFFFFALIILVGIAFTIKLCVTPIERYDERDMYQPVRMRDNKKKN